MKHLITFFNIVSSLKSSLKENYETDVGNNKKSILNHINEFKNHSSIKIVKCRKKEEKTTFLMKKFLTKLAS